MSSNVNNWGLSFAYERHLTFDFFLWNLDVVVGISK